MHKVRDRYRSGSFSLKTYLRAGMEGRRSCKSRRRSAWYLEEVTAEELPAAWRKMPVSVGPRGPSWHHQAPLRITRKYMPHACMIKRTIRSVGKVV